VDLGLALVNRSFDTSVIKVADKENNRLWWVFGETGTLLAAVFTSPAGRELFRFGPLHGHDVVLVVLVVGSAMFLSDGLKRIESHLARRCYSVPRSRTALSRWQCFPSEAGLQRHLGWLPKVVRRF
jgi:hypothetical protein